MRIAFFHNLPKGGALRTIYEQIHYLSVHHEIDLYSLGDSSYKDIDRYVANKWMEEFELDNKLPFFLNRIIKDYRNFISLRIKQKYIAKMIDKKRYDVVVVHSDRFTESPFVLRYLRTINVYHCHELLRIVYEKELDIDNDWPLPNRVYEKITRYFRRSIDKKNAQSADQIITSSDYIRKMVNSAYGRKAKRIHTGVDINVFKPSPNVKRDLILYLGGQSKLKGYEIAKKAFAISKTGKYWFISLGYGKGDKYVGRDPDLVRYYNRSLVTLCPASNEPFGLIPLESMACETPVIAVDEGGYRETIINGSSGFLVEKSAKSFAEKIDLLVDNPKLAEKLGKFGRRHVVENFTWEKHVNELEKYLLKLVNEEKGIGCNSYPQK